MLEANQRYRDLKQMKSENTASVSSLVVSVHGLTNENKELNALLKDLKPQVESKQAELDRLTQELAEAEAKSTDQGWKVAWLEAEKGDQAKKFNELELKLEESGRFLEDMRVENERLLSQIETDLDTIRSLS